MTIQPVILCGGSGTHLWPLSREHYPKQLLSLMGEMTLLQATLQRLNGAEALLALSASVLIVCNEEHRFVIADQVHRIGVRARPIILEPVGKGTAPALTLAALHVLSEDDPVLLAMPCDHVISDRHAFHEAIARGAVLADDGFLVVFGVPPTFAEPGYGYIRVGAETSAGHGPAAHYLDSLVEKPDAETAKQYLTSGCYLWNSGIFAMRASVWIEILGRLRPDILVACERAYRHGTWDADFYRADGAAFADSPRESIDCAVMDRLERKSAARNAPHALVVRLEAGWLDVGAWDTLWEIESKDADGNVIHGDVCAVDTRGTLLIAQHRLLACAGLEDMVIVETPDAVMVARRDKAQEVTQVVSRLKRAARRECVTHRKVYRSWGSYDGVDGGERFQVKRLFVNPGASLSLQAHYHRAEHWIVVRGTAKVTRNDQVFLLTENQSTYIPLGMKHRLENPGKLPLEIIEVQSGSYLGEDDTVRFEEASRRTETPRHTGKAPPLDAARPPERSARADALGGRRAMPKRYT